MMKRLRSHKNEEEEEEEEESSSSGHMKTGSTKGTELEVSISNSRSAYPKVPSKVDSSFARFTHDDEVDELTGNHQASLETVMLCARRCCAVVVYTCVCA